MEAGVLHTGAADWCIKERKIEKEPTTKMMSDIYAAQYLLIRYLGMKYNREIQLCLFSLLVVVV